MKRSGSSRRLVLVSAAALGLLACSVPLAAWKSVVHVYLSMLARADAIDDGRVTIYEVDYENGRFATDAAGNRKIIGTYAVNPAILDALRRYPQQFKAGAIGPDAYPDILTGQTGIHPDNSGRGHGISDDWLKLVWGESLKTPSLQVRAFAVGFLAHAAGDLFGHTFVNNYSGGPFAIGENALKHIVLENYIDKRTPVEGQDFWDISIEGVEGFLYRQLVIGPLIPPASAGDIAAHPAYFFNYSLPRAFINLKGFVNDMHAACAAEVARYSREISARLREANDCKVSDPPRSARLAAEAAELKIEKTAYEAADAYFRAWLRDIEDGRRAWPAFGHELGKAALFNPGGFDRERFSDVAQDYFNKHLLSMLGAPDVLGDSLAAMKLVKDYIDSYIPEWFKEIIHFLRTDFEMYLIEKAWGLTLEMLTWPEVHFDPVMNNNLTDNTGERITLRDFNRDVLKINDTAFFTQEKYDWTKIPAMVNSLTMMKLLMLSREGVGRLIDDLEQKGLTSNGFDRLLVPGAGDVPVILGFMGSLDDDNQWCRDPRMLFARDGCAYRKLFMRQKGEDEPGCFTGCDTPPDGSVVAMPVESPLAPGFSGYNMGRRPDGGLIQWGKEFIITMNNGSASFREFASPELKAGVPPAAAVVIHSPEDRVVVLARDGTVWTWGFGAHGQVGLWDTKDRFEPIRVPNLESIVQVASGTRHVLALRSNGQVWVWGTNNRGVLGLGARMTPARPRRIPGLNGIRRVIAGGYFSLALRQSGEVLAWGSNDFFQLGDETKEDRYSPAPVVGLAGVREAAAGYAHVLALKEDGSVWSWGNNYRGQLGDGGTTDRPNSAPVPGLGEIVAVAAGGYQSVALDRNGSVWVWGEHYVDLSPIRGAPRRSAVPVKVPGLPPIVAVACGENHTLALDRDGAVWTWGAKVPGHKPVKVPQVDLK